MFLKRSFFPTSDAHGGLFKDVWLSWSLQFFKKVFWFIFIDFLHHWKSRQKSNLQTHEKLQAKRATNQRPHFGGRNHLPHTYNLLNLQLVDSSACRSNTSSFHSTSAVFTGWWRCKYNNKKVTVWKELIFISLTLNQQQYTLQYLRLWSFWANGKVISITKW